MQTDEIEKLLAEATPGPWFCNDDPRDGMEWNIHIHHTGEDRICFMSNMGESRVDEVEADARLIAMAPDLAAEVVRLRAENERLREALTPSCDTKAAYMGEIHCDCPTENWKHFVPWTSIKEIMAMIRARAGAGG